MAYMSFSLNTDNFVLPSEKFKCHTLFQEISDASNVVIYHAVTFKLSEKK